MDGGDVLADTLFFLLLFGVVLAAFTECCEQEKQTNARKAIPLKMRFGLLRESLGMRRLVMILP